MFLFSVTYFNEPFFFIMISGHLYYLEIFLKLILIQKLKKKKKMLIIEEVFFLSMYELHFLMYFLNKLIDLRGNIM